MYTEHKKEAVVDLLGLSNDDTTHARRHQLATVRTPNHFLETITIRRYSMNRKSWMKESIELH